MIKALGKMFAVVKKVAEPDGRLLTIGQDWKKNDLISQFALDRLHETTRWSCG
jgi:hypothetical protein